MDDFNMTAENHHLRDLAYSIDFENLKKESTCFKSTLATTIGLLLTNRKGCFMKSSTNETGISDHYKLIYTFLKSTYTKGNPKFVSMDALKTLTKNCLRIVNLPENSKTLVIHLKFF